MKLDVSLSLTVILEEHEALPSFCLSGVKKSVINACHFEARQTSELWVLPCVQRRYVV